MTIEEHTRELHGLRIHDFTAPTAGTVPDLPPADQVAWRLTVPYCPFPQNGGHVPFEELFEQFLNTVDPSGVRALVIGTWGGTWDEINNKSAATVVDALTGAKGRLTALRALFIGDIIQEENEVSWIKQCDVTPVLHAYPALAELAVRGSDGLEFPAVTHTGLRTLRIETGGLPAKVTRGVAASDLPALHHLELWLGPPNELGDTEPADLAPILAGNHLPVLRHLGLMNSEITDDIAALIAASRVTAQLASLSLAMGILTDTGAENLLAGQPLTHLTHLDLHHHFLSDTMMQRLKNTLEPHGVTLDLSEQYDPHSWGRYVAVEE